MIAQFIAHLILPNKKKSYNFNPSCTTIPYNYTPYKVLKIIKHFTYKNPSVVIQDIGNISVWKMGFLYARRENKGVQQ